MWPCHTELTLRCRSSRDHMCRPRSGVRWAPPTGAATDPHPCTCPGVLTRPPVAAVVFNMYNLSGDGFIKENELFAMLKRSTSGKVADGQLRTVRPLCACSWRRHASPSAQLQGRTQPGASAAMLPGLDTPARLDDSAIMPAANRCCMCTCSPVRVRDLTGRVCIARSPIAPCVQHCAPKPSSHWVHRPITTVLRWQHVGIVATWRCEM